MNKIYSYDEILEACSRKDWKKAFMMITESAYNLGFIRKEDYDKHQEWLNNDCDNDKWRRTYFQFAKTLQNVNLLLSEVNQEKLLEMITMEEKHEKEMKEKYRLHHCEIVFATIVRFWNNTQLHKIHIDDYHYLRKNKRIDAEFKLERWGKISNHKIKVKVNPCENKDIVSKVIKALFDSIHKGV